MRSVSQRKAILERYKEHIDKVRRRIVFALAELRLISTTGVSVMLCRIDVFLLSFAFSKEYPFPCCSALKYELVNEVTMSPL